MAAAGNDSAAPPATPAPADSGSNAPAPGGTAAPDPASSAPGGDAPPADPKPGASPAPGAPGTKPPAKAAAVPPTGAPAKPAGTPSGMVPLGALNEARNELRTIKESHGWLPKEHAPAFRQFYESYQRDPVAAIAENLNELLGHPQHGPRLRALMGGAGEDAEPQPDMVDREQGIHAYSPDQLRKWQAWHQRQSDARLAERLSPIEQHIHDQRTRDRETAAQAAVRERREQAVSRAKAVFAEVRANPHFGPNEAAIKVRWEQHVQSMAPDAALYRAMSEVLSEQMAGAGTAAADDLAASLTRRAGAPNARPGSGPANSGTPARPADFHESAARMFR